MQATGEFHIQFEPQVPSFKGSNDIKIGRMSIRKKYIGTLEALSVGEMLSASNSAREGSAGYIAMEQIIGTLNGLKGSFVLQHFGIKDSQHQDQRIEVVPGSGTGELANLKGALTIRIDGGKHFYELNYSID